VLRTTALFAASLALGLLGAACGGRDEAAGRASPATEPGPPLVEGLERETRELDRRALAADALEPGRLSDLLDDAGFRVGLEDEYSGRTELYDHVVSRRLEFSNADGAVRYVEWLRSNAADLLGTAKRAASFDVGANGFLTRDAGCGCHSDLPTFLAAWRDGADVRTLLADGPGVDRARFVALAHQLG
jgi:hypothetical protein